MDLDLHPLYRDGDLCPKQLGRENRWGVRDPGCRERARLHVSKQGFRLIFFFLSRKVGAWGSTK